jgi:hypothetical protein
MDRLLVLKAPIAVVSKDLDSNGNAVTATDLNDLGVGSLALVNDVSGNGFAITKENFKDGVLGTLSDDITPRTKWRFVVKDSSGGYSYSHDINPAKLSWNVQKYVAGTKQVSTYGFTVGSISGTNIQRIPLAINFNVYDLRQDGDKNITPNRITFKQSFYWNSTYSATTAELERELKVFVKKINSLAKGRYVASVASSVVTITALEFNIKFNVTIDEYAGNPISITPTNTTPFGYGYSTIEQAKQLEYRVSPSYGHNPIALPGEDNIYTHKSEIDESVPGYATIVIRSGNEPQHDLFVADNAGLVGTTYILIPQTTDTVSIDNGNLVMGGSGTAASPITTKKGLDNTESVIADIQSILTKIKALSITADSPV